jgi:C-terminal processing protease CtpA/Prc
MRKLPLPTHIPTLLVCCVLQIATRLYVAYVWEGGPAQAQGIRVGDEIFSINGRTVENMDTVEVRA